MNYINFISLKGILCNDNGQFKYKGLFKNKVYDGKGKKMRWNFINLCSH